MGCVPCILWSSRLCTSVIAAGKIIEKQKDIQTYRHTDRKTERQKERKTERQNDRKTERQKDRKTERQKDRKTDNVTNWII